MRIINLTPHVINIHLPSGEILNIPPSGNVARVGSTAYALTPITVDGKLVPVNTNHYGEVEGLPPEGFTAEDPAYVVSGMILAQCPDRRDLYAPGALVRDSDGQPIGCLGLRQ